jgi:hypothetical protein
VSGGNHRVAKCAAFESAVSIKDSGDAGWACVVVDIVTPSVVNALIRTVAHVKKLALRF